jgi:uncharacterized repeat protein (TIGR03803 family)
MCLAAQGPVYRLLYSPPLGSNLGDLYGIFEAKPGLFYILSVWNGGATGASIFTVTSQGAFSPIYSFPQLTTMDYAVEATNGRLYGSGFAGTPPYANFYYSLDLSGKDLQEYPFPGTWGPTFNTTVAPPSQIYDLAGQVVSGQTVYGFAQVSESGQITILHQFAGSDGVPDGYTRLILGPDGNFYGIGAEQEHGISPMFIYRFTPSGAYSKLLTFPQVPGYDAFPLVAASDGNLYGTFSKGGVNGTGVIYQATLSGQLHTLASFPAAISSPRSLMQAADGNLYGTTVYNQIFRYNLTTHVITLVYQMDVGGSQGHCACILVEGMDGKLYGAAPNGGNYPGMGAVFSLDIGLPKPSPVVSGLYPPSGGDGQKVVLWGNYLLGATSVSFNGNPAQYIAVTSTQSVYATVPPTATSGPVTITTPNGSFTTTTSFTVE